MAEPSERDFSRALELAAAAWPRVNVEPAAFFARLIAAVPPDDVERSLAQLPVADLYLALGCERGDRAALEAFELHFLAHVPEFIARVDPSPALAEEVKQELRDRLFVPRAGAQSQIAGYSGRGDLGAWLRVVAVRTALRLRRMRWPSRERPLEQTASIGETADPELSYLKLRYRGAYEEAFRAALASLETRERLLLKLHYGDGLSLERIASVYRMHRATVARRLASCRRKLREETQRRLQETLQVSAAEFGSLLELVRSQLCVSLRAMQADRTA
jgi:RNA polymerase sigma-70 factor (ECF subfamily)